MKKQFKWIWYAIWAVICLVGGGGTLFSWMPRSPMMFYGGCAMLTLAVMAGVLLLLLAKGKTFKKAWLPALISGAAYAVVVAVIVYVCDEVIFKDIIADYQPVHSSLAVVVLNFVLTVALCIAVPKKYDPKLTWLKRGIALILCIVALVLSGLPQNWWWGIYNYKTEAMKRVTAPTGFSSYTEKETVLVDDAQLYVAVDGSDENDGSFEKPFATIEKARDVIRQIDKTGKSGITVAIKAGEYRVGSIVFTEEDSGTAECPITYCAYGDGEVILNAGVTLNPADFEQVSGTQAERLSAEAREHVVCIDLGKYGVTAEDYGNLHATGDYSTAHKYDGGYTGAANCELFVNDARQTIARYPNEGWLYTYEVVEEGEPKESASAPNVVIESWAEQRNHKGDTYRLEKDLADRINSWATLEDVWAYGYWYYDWAPGSTIIGEFNYEDRTIYHTFVSVFGAKADAPYYFYNVFEELDTEGEWYLDRDTGILYLYEPEDFANAELMLSVSTENIIRVENANHLTFSGFTVFGTRGDAIDITGSNNTVEYCLIKNIAGTAVKVAGYNNLISSNEITKTGNGGVYVTSGDSAIEGVHVTGSDFETLTHGNNRVYNNHIHHWGEVGGLKGIECYGVGNLIDHNELHDYRDTAIRYGGNDHIIEYNLIHDVDLETSDGGAIYDGRSWTDYGCIVRYNCIYNMGTPGFSTPNGIYLDDGLSGQQVYGNLLVNVPQNGIKIGGGRDNEVWGNVIINTAENGIIGLQPPLYAGTYAYNVWATLLPNLEASAWQSDIWQEAYPQMKDLYFDMDNQDSPNFWGNAANNKVNGNLVVNQAGALGEFAEEFTKYSDISGNAVYTMDMLEEIFADPENGDYRLKEDSIVYDVIPDFENIPIEQIGRE